MAVPAWVRICERVNLVISCAMSVSRIRLSDADRFSTVTLRLLTVCLNRFWMAPRSARVVDTVLMASSIDLIAAEAPVAAANVGVALAMSADVVPRAPASVYLSMLAGVVKVSVSPAAPNGVAALASPKAEAAAAFSFFSAAVASSVSAYCTEARSSVLPAKLMVPSRLLNAETSKLAPAKSLFAVLVWNASVAAALSPASVVTTLPAPAAVPLVYLPVPLTSTPDTPSPAEPIAVPMLTAMVSPPLAPTWKVVWYLPSKSFWPLKFVVLADPVQLRLQLADLRLDVLLGVVVEATGVGGLH